MLNVIIDARNIFKIASYSMLSGSVACIYPTEPEEIAHRIAKRLYCIRAAYPGARIVLANDRAPYWRSAYLDQWYSDHALEPVPYKGNRAGRPWPFASTVADINAVYDTVQKQCAIALEMEIIEDVGLEADDIWGLLVARGREDEANRFVGITADSDWRQLCGPQVTVVDPGTGKEYTAEESVLHKMIAGDRGDNVMGCIKYRKDGTPGTMWGTDGAKKLLARGGDWSRDLDPSILERNHAVVVLPCPLWDVAEAHDALMACAVPVAAFPEAYRHSILDRFGIKAELRKQLADKEIRGVYIENMRARLQKENEAV